MRVALLLGTLCALLLAGCTQGDPGKTSSFQATCPTWVEGLSTSIFRETFNQNSTETLPRKDALGKGLESNDGFPLDKVVLDFYPRPTQNKTELQGIYAQDSRLSVSATRDDDGTPLLLYDPAKGPASDKNPGKATWVFASDQLLKDFQLQADLVGPGKTADATSVTLAWMWERDLDHDPQTPTGATLFYTAKYLYRTC